MIMAIAILCKACQENFCHVIENTFKTYVNVNSTMQKKRYAMRNLIRIYEGHPIKNEAFFMVWKPKYTFN